MVVLELGLLANTKRDLENCAIPMGMRTFDTNHIFVYIVYYIYMLLVL